MYQKSHRPVSKLFVGWLVTIGLVAPGSAATSPWAVPSTPVEDHAGLLGPLARRELCGRLAAYREASGCRIVVTTHTELPAPRFVRRSFTSWWESWGRPDCAAAIYLFAREQRARVMVAPAMRRELTLEELGGILEGAVLPRFAAGDPEGAVIAGVETLQTALGGDLEELPAPFRPSTVDRILGFAALGLAAAASSLALLQLRLAWRQRRPASAEDRR